MKVGDIVTLKNFGTTPTLLGVVVKLGEEERGMYGGGIQFTDYVEVRWFNSGHHHIARYTPPNVSLKIISSAA